MGKLGDIVDNDLRQTLEQWEHLGRRPYIVSPTWNPQQIAGMDAVQALLERHMIPRLWQLLADFPEVLKRHVLRVQQPGWLEPPASSEPEDLCSESPVALTNGTAVNVLEYQVPDRHVVSFKWFGQMLDVSTEWGTVVWSILVNNKPVRTYFEFKQQRGNFMNPTRLASPIKLKSKDVLVVQATGGPNPVNAYARLQGWVMAATSVTQDGSYKDWNVR